MLIRTLNRYAKLASIFAKNKYLGKNYRFFTLKATIDKKPLSREG
jgi:hypothetical protein